MSLPSLPFEIIISILLLLPAKELIKLLVTCKSWYAMIKDQDFIKKHFESSVATGKNYLLYVPVQSKPEKTFTLLNAKNFHHESELRVPFDLPGMLNCVVVSSVNGLICLTDISCFGHIIYLTNPTINKYLTLPPSTIYFHELDLQIIQVSLGFGYHEKTNDFMVVRIGFVENDCYGWLDEEDDDDDVEPSRLPHGYDFVSRAEVFSLNTKVWKEIKLSCNFSYKRHDMFSGVVVNECLHWKVVKSNTYEDEMVILSYHLGEETFQEFECPKFQGEGGVDLTECIGEFKGKLGLFAFCAVFDYWFGIRGQPCHLWVMEEYGVKNSWTCHATISLGMMIYRPLAFTRNGEIIIQDRFASIYSYDFSNNQLLDLKIQAEEHDLNFVNFTDSLVLVDLNDKPMGQEGATPANGGGVDFDGYMHMEEVNMVDKDDPPGDTPMNVEK
ncbi:PREDICTED: F-box protein CPR30-like [Nicotiana attenuata]|nr:PREDICTED: F-box protein CPR30-like [Nicotiana attenuata]